MDLIMQAFVACPVRIQGKTYVRAVYVILSSCSDSSNVPGSGDTGLPMPPHIITEFFSLSIVFIKFA